MLSSRAIVEEQRYRIVGLLLIVIWILSSVRAAAQKEPDVIYVPTPDTVVQKMMEMANVGPGDYVVDLGSGDGRIVIEAARRGAVGHGVEIDPKRIKEARKNARKARVQDRVTFIQEDLFKHDFSRANVVMMYLLQSLNLKLRPKLLKQLEPGTPVVSHSFNMGKWEADKYAMLEGNQVYLWYIPADVEGLWSWKVNGKTFNASFRQKFQRVGITLRAPNAAMTVQDITLQGKRISFIAEKDNIRYVYSGEVKGNRINGMVQIHKNDGKQVKKWEAERK